MKQVRMPFSCKWPAMLGPALLFLLPAVVLFSGSSARAMDAGPVWTLNVCSVKDNLPYSNEQLGGFENQIAALLANQLNADLNYVWLTRTHNPALVESLLREGLCDVFMGIADGQEPFLSTISYYRSTSVFVVRADAPFTVTSLDDPALPELRIGVVRASPADFALAARNMIENVRHFSPTDEVGAIIDAVIEGKIDVGIVWGPIAGYVAQMRSIRLTITAVTPQIDLPFLPFVTPVSIGVRADDIALRDQLNDAIAEQWDEIQGVLQAFSVPLLPLPRPTVTLGGN